MFTEKQSLRLIKKMKRKIKKPRIEIWGSYPPPVGGVTIHIKRLFYRTRESGVFDIILKNFLGSTHRPEEGIYKVRFVFWEFVKLFFVSRRVIHIHMKHILTWLSFLFFGFRHTGLLTLHSQELRQSYPLWREFIIKRFLKRMKYILFNDAEFAEILIKKYNINSKKLVIIPAFIPPIKQEISVIPEKMLAFREKHKFLISANAWQLELRNGVDLYGFDLLIDLLQVLREKKMNTGLIFCLPIVGDTLYFNQLMERVKKYNLEENILIWFESAPSGFTIWQLSDLFIRPTITDMEGISVKEALSVGTPVIASDVCPRPKEAFVFKNRNFQQLVDLSVKVLQHPPEIHFKDSGGVNKIWECYKELQHLNYKEW